MLRRLAATAWVWGSTLLVAAGVLVACGGAHHAASPRAPETDPTTSVSVQDAKLAASDFRNIHTMTPVGDHFVTNVRDHLAQALAVARSPRGGDYPVGTIIQLIPQEAMVKRRPGFSPSTNDWEFFSLDVSVHGTKILSRGGAQVLNRFGGSCASCHSAAAKQFDFVCGTNHGCAPLPIGPKVIAGIQAADPRPLH